MEKSFNTMTPRSIPPKRDIVTLREYNAKTIAIRDGKSDITEGSILNLSKFDC